MSANPPKVWGAGIVVALVVKSYPQLEISFDLARGQLFDVVGNHNKYTYSLSTVRCYNQKVYDRILLSANRVKVYSASLLVYLHDKMQVRVPPDGRSDVGCPRRRFTTLL